jgi:hypothetical protein
LDEKPSLNEVAYAAKLLRDLKPDHEQAVFDAIKPILRLRISSG